MSDELNFLPSLTGSFAKPAAENPTVEMVEAAYRHHGLHWRYINTEVGPENLGEAVAGARAMNWAGFNCSIPNKVESNCTNFDNKLLLINYYYFRNIDDIGSLIGDNWS